MKHPNLQAIITQENWYRKMIGKPEIHIHGLIQSEVDELVRSIDGSLSPENLHCDGEISRTQAMAKYRKLTGALKELSKMGFQVNSYEYQV